MKCLAAPAVAIAHLAARWLLLTQWSIVRNSGVTRTLQSAENEASARDALLATASDCEKSTRASGGIPTKESGVHTLPEDKV
jgi:hypothetical protein